ncbi:MAG: histidine phosphatase family protein [Pseudomonadota bacterium]
MRALLIRHAQSAHQAPDAPLTKLGRDQAERLVAPLKALGAGPLYASPYARAVLTLRPYANASAQTITELADLAERRLSAERLSDWQDHIRKSFDNVDHRAPGGETHREVLERAARALRQIEEPGGPLPAFVTHGGLTSALFHDHDPSFGFEGWVGLRNPDLFDVTLEDGRITSFQRHDLEA